MLSKRLILLLGIFSLSFAILSACGGANDDATPTDEAPATDQTPADETTEDEGNDEAAADEPEADATLVAAGETVVKQSCVGCHGANLEGNVGPTLHNVASKYSEEELYDILVNGIGTMPKNTAAGNEDAVIAYLVTLD